eukprot:3010599-Pyramimonas_sp.AAC.1
MLTASDRRRAGQWPSTCTAPPGRGPVPAQYGLGDADGTGRCLLLKAHPRGGHDAIPRAGVLP